jgi:hypothetical protein
VQTVRRRSRGSLRSGDEAVAGEWLRLAHSARAPLVLTDARVDASPLPPRARPPTHTPRSSISQSGSMATRRGAVLEGYDFGAWAHAGSRPLCARDRGWLQPIMRTR